MDEENVVGDIASASQACIAAFKGLQRHQTSSDAPQSALTNTHVAVAETTASTHQETSGPRITSEITASGSYSNVTFWDNVENIFARFKIWIANLGALQRGSSSLDVRLRDTDVMRIAVLQVLSSLQETLVECTKVITGERLPFEMQNRLQEDHNNSDSSDYTESEDDEDSAELEIRTKTLETLLAELYRLSFKIRNTRFRGTASKAAALKSVDRDSGIDVFSIYKHLDRQHVFEHLSSIRGKQQVSTGGTYTQNPIDNEANLRWPSVAESDHQMLVRHPISTYITFRNDVLAQRLAAANTRRRQCFAYWRRHALKLAVEREFSVTTKSPKKLEPVVNSLEPLVIKDVLRTPSQAAPTVLSGTNATTIHPDVQDALDTETVFSYATTAYGMEGDTITFPPPPVQDAGQIEFLCPLCHVVCPSKQGQGKEWRMHVIHDLQPYICTYDECDTADMLYASRAGWLEHERVAHRRVWQCQEHPSTIFSSREAFQDHLDQEHDQTNHTYAQEVASFAESTVPDNRIQCPFCLKSDMVTESMHHHMAFHQEHIAAFTLSWYNSDLNEDEATSSRAQADRARMSIGSLPLDFDEMDSRQNPHQEQEDVISERMSFIPASFEGIRAMAEKQLNEDKKAGKTIIISWTQTNDTAIAAGSEKEVMQTSGISKEELETISMSESEHVSTDTEPGIGAGAVVLRETSLTRSDSSDHDSFRTAPFAAQGSIDAIEELDRDITKRCSKDEAPPFDVISTLGQGVHTIVQKVRSTTTGREYVQKRIRTLRRGYKTEERVQTEIKILRRIVHRHCIELICSYVVGRQYAILMLPVAQCNLENFLDEVDGGVSSSASLLYDFFGCLANALRYLHDNKIRHRDIKPTNILVRGDCVLLAGFGIASEWQDRESDWDDGSTSFTRRYAAPEVLLQKPNNSASDIWSLGCVFLEMGTILDGVTNGSLKNHLYDADAYDGRTSSTFAGGAEILDSWIVRLDIKGHTGTGPPFTWVRDMLKQDHTDRPTAASLFDRIVRNSRKMGTSFCGSCCMEDLKPMEDDYEEHEGDHFVDQVVEGESRLREADMWQ
ncbi:hypothetical protein DE146DRAFT_640763 [Phaeosphaeria sp. MPI-PUGE-AT-0046c]|nr:hypothetical protein DE146DRAFT_640763 [Phaeosphaeria sp. MPI-PUGE-AT-0046c]